MTKYITSDGRIVLLYVEDKDKDFVNEKLKEIEFVKTSMKHLEINFDQILKYETMIVNLATKLPLEFDLEIIKVRDTREKTRTELSALKEKLKDFEQNLITKYQTSADK